MTPNQLTMSALMNPGLMIMRNQIQIRHQMIRTI